MNRCVADDLTTSLFARVGGKAVLEHRDVVVGFGDLGLFFSGTGGAKRAVVRGRVIGAVLPPRRDGDPLFQQRMPAKLAQLTIWLRAARSK